VHRRARVPCRAFAKSLGYSQVNLGAVVVRDAAAIDDLFDQMKALEFDREDDAGGLSKARLEVYQVRGRRCGAVVPRRRRLCRHTTACPAGRAAARLPPLLLVRAQLIATARVRRRTLA
jgi:hypothetical protein